MTVKNENTLFFLDANIVMYCLGREHPLKAPCLQVVERIRDGRLSVCTSTEV